MSDKVSLTKLVAVSYNPRIISTEQLERLKASIKEHTSVIPEDTRGDGFRLTTTVTINKNGNRIVGGHQRIKALNSLGQSWIHKDDITWVDIPENSAKEKALNVTLNSEKFQGNWDQSKLDAIIDDIKIESPELYSNLDFGPIDVDIPSVNIDTPSSPTPGVPQGNYNPSAPSSDFEAPISSTAGSSVPVSTQVDPTQPIINTKEVVEDRTVISKREYNEDDINKANDKLTHAQENKVFEHRNIMCPGCGHEFIIKD